MSKWHTEVMVQKYIQGTISCNDCWGKDQKSGALRKGKQRPANVVRGLGTILISSLQTTYLNTKTSIGAPGYPMTHQGLEFYFLSQIPLY